MLGNLFRECGVVDRLLKTSENELLNVVTILLGLSVGASMTAAGFLTLQTLFIIL
ncbi:MAG TPA: glutaconyl-CoA decarboxylase subunit beta, partial [Nitrospina sp.]|nr:glutaconyl-CoA decarboxylase subunit beta [Nitrospina sp.]